MKQFVFTRKGNAFLRGFLLLLCLFLVLALLFPFSAAASSGDGSPEKPFTDVENDATNFPVYPAEHSVFADKTTALVDGFSIEDNPYAKVTLQVNSVEAGPVAAISGDIFLLLDCSASMLQPVGGGGETRMDAMQRTAIRFAERLLADPTNDFRVGVISFGFGARTVCDLTDDMGTVQEAIQNLTPTEPYTMMSHAFNQAYTSLQAAGRDKQYIIALSDGDVNGGDGQNTLTAAANAAAAGINIYTIGFAHTSQMLEDIVSGSGIYQNAMDANGLQNVFDTIIARLLSPNSEAVVTDIIGPNFEIVPSSKEHPWLLAIDDVMQPGAESQISQNGNEIRWEIGTIPGSTQFSLYIRLLNPAAPGQTLPVSEKSELFYKNHLDSYCLRLFPEASLTFAEGNPSSSSSSASSSSSSSVVAEIPGNVPPVPASSPNGVVGILSVSSSESSSISSSSTTSSPSSSSEARVYIPPKRLPLIPTAPKTTGLSGTNLLFSFACAAISSVLFVSLFARKNVEEKPVHKISPPWKVLSVLLGLISVAVFFTTQDFSGGLGVADGWTMWQVALLAAQLVSVLIGYATHTRVCD